MSKWTMKDGTQISIKKMESSHLVNAMKMLERSAPQMLDAEIDAAFGALSAFQGEMAIYETESQLLNLERMTAEDFLYMHTPYGEMEEELNRRERKGLYTPVVVNVSEKILTGWAEKYKESRGKR